MYLMLKKTNLCYLEMDMWSAKLILLSIITLRFLGTVSEDHNLRKTSVLDRLKNYVRRLQNPNVAVSGAAVRIGNLSQPSYLEGCHRQLCAGYA